MKYLRYFNMPEINASRIALGLMRIACMSAEKVAALVGDALEQGINFFDNAEDYKIGDCHTETLFGQALRLLDVRREDIYIQSKIGYSFFPMDDSSFRDHTGAVGLLKHIDNSGRRIIEGVESSLRRLGTDYLDVLLLHRPDALMEPDEVAEAFDRLYTQGKVRAFGVSNFAPTTIELLSRALNVPLVVNQMQFGLLNSAMVDVGFNCNRSLDVSVDYAVGALDYLRLRGIVLQTWGSYGHGFFDGPFIGNPEFPIVNEKLEAYAEKKNSTPMGVYTAWLLRHPCQMQVVAGSTKPERLRQICEGTEIDLSRGEWYDIYLSASKTIY